MKIRRSALEGIAGVVVLAAAPVAANAQTVTMGVSMSLTSLASGTSTAMNFGSIPANPLGGSVQLYNIGTSVTNSVSGGGLLGGASLTGTQGTLTFTRTVSVKAIVTAPTLVTMSCPGGVISITAFTVVTAGTTSTVDCTLSNTTSCSYNVGATASLPASLTTGSCTTGTASFTVQYQ